MHSYFEYDDNYVLSDAQLLRCGFQKPNGNSTRLDLTDIETGDPDIPRLAAGESACWNILSADKEAYSKQTIILTDFALRTSACLNESIIIWINALFVQNFTIYIWTGSLLRMHSLTELQTHAWQIKPVPAKTIIDLLEKVNLRRDQVKIVDYFERKRICNLIQEKVPVEPFLDYKIFNEATTIGIRKDLVESLSPHVPFHLELDDSEISGHTAQTLLKLPQLNSLTVLIENANHPLLKNFFTLHGHKIKELNIAGTESWDLLPFHLCTALNSLYLSEIRHTSSNSPLIVPPVKNLSITGCSFEVLYKILKKVEPECLEITGVKNPCYFVESLKLKRLRRLKLSNTDASFLELVYAAPWIEALHLDGIKIFDTDASFPKVKHLVLNNLDINPLLYTRFLNPALRSLRVDGSFPHDLDALELLPELQTVEVHKMDYAKTLVFTQRIIKNPQLTQFKYIAETFQFFYKKNHWLLQSGNSSKSALADLFFVHTEKLERLMIKESKTKQFKENIPEFLYKKLHSLTHLTIPSLLIAIPFPQLNALVCTNFSVQQNTLTILKPLSFSLIEKIMMHPGFRISHLLLNDIVYEDADFSKKPFLSIEHIEISHNIAFSLDRLLAQTPHLISLTLHPDFSMNVTLPPIKNLTLGKLHAKTDITNFSGLASLSLKKISTLFYLRNLMKITSHLENFTLLPAYQDNLDWLPDGLHKIILHNKNNTIKRCKFPDFHYVKDQLLYINIDIDQKFTHTLIHRMNYAESLKIKPIIRFEKIQAVLAKFNLHEMELTAEVQDYACLPQLAKSLLENHPNLKTIALKLYQKDAWFVLNSKKRILKTNLSLSTTELSFFLSRVALHFVAMDALHGEKQYLSLENQRLCTLHIEKQDAFLEYLACFNKKFFQKYQCSSASTKISNTELCGEELAHSTILSSYYLHRTQIDIQKILLKNPSKNLLGSFNDFFKAFGFIEIISSSPDAPHLLTLFNQLITKKAITIVVKNTDLQILFSILITPEGNIELTGPRFPMSLFNTFQLIGCTKRLTFNNFHFPSGMVLSVQMCNTLKFYQCDVTMEFFNNLPALVKVDYLENIFLSECPYINFDELTAWSKKYQTMVSISKPSIRIYSRKNSQYGDAQTGEQCAENLFHGKQDCWFTAANGEIPLQNYLRIHVDAQRTNQPLLVNIPYVNKNDIKPLFSGYKTRDIFISRVFTFNISPARLHPLPSLSPTDKILHYYSSHPVSFYYDKVSDLYYAGSKEAIVVDIIYIVQATPEIIQLDKDFWKPYKPWFPCLQALDPHKKSIKPWYASTFETLKKLPNIQKRNIALAFCASFKPKEPTEDVRAEQILRKIFQYRRGVCRHKKIALRALVNLLDITGVRMLGNGVHAFAEIYQDGQWHMVCMGGVEMPEFEMKNDHKDRQLPVRKVEKQNLFQENKPPILPEKLQNALPAIPASNTTTTDRPSEPSNIRSAAIPAIFKPKKNFPNPFNHPKSALPLLADDFLQLCVHLLGIANTLKPGQKNLLIQFQSLTQIEQFHAQMAALVSKSKRYIFVDSLQTIKPLELTIKNGKLFRPVFHLITEITNASDGDVCIVNINDYEGSMVNTLNALVDSTGRTIAAQPVAENLIIIAVKLKEIELDIDALSRFKNHFYEIPALSEKDLFSAFCRPSEHISENAIDFCYTGDSWQKHLSGIIKLQGSHLIYAPGQLSPSKKILECYNLPLHLPDLRLFLLTLFYTKQYYANGEYHKIATDFCIHHAPKKHMLPSRLSWHVQAFNQNAVHDFVLNRGTFFQFFQNYFYKKGVLRHTEGLFHHIKKSSAHILVTESLDEIGFIQLLEQAKIAGKYCIFTFAKDISIPESMQHNIQRPRAPITAPCDNRYIVSSDPDFTECIEFQHAAVITINKHTRFSALFDSIKILNGQKDKLPAQLTKGLAHALLKEGKKTVILKGTPSSELLQKLQTLFMPAPYIYINNKKITYRKPLILLSKQALPWHVPCQTDQYTHEDYHIFLKKHENQEKLAAFKKLYEQLIDQAKASGIPLQHGFRVYQNMYKLFTWYPQQSINPFLPFLGLHPQYNILRNIALNLCPEPDCHITNEKEWYAQKNDLMQYFLKTFHGVVLEGETGTGKSTFVKTWLQNNKPYHIGLPHMQRWGAEKGILFLDNIQRSPENALQPLECMLQTKKYLVIENSVFPLTPQHAVIFATNKRIQENDIQPAFLQQFPVIQFQSLPQWLLEKQLLLPVLEQIPDNLVLIEKQNIACFFMKALQKVNQTLTNTLWTPRNLESILLRFALFRSRDTALSPMQAAVASVYDELENNRDDAVREKLLLWLKIYFPDLQAWEQRRNSQLIPYRGPAFTLTQCRKNMYRIILDQVAQPSLPLCRPFPVLLEGSSGTGKSHTILNALEALGFHNGNVPENKRTSGRCYHFITAEDDRNILPSKDQLTPLEQRLTSIFHQGDWVVIDELNTLPSLNKILLAFLSGVDLAGEPAKNPGFRLLATQNPVSYIGRQKTETDQFFFMKIPEYSEKGLQEIAVDKGLNPSFAGTVSHFFIKKKKINHSVREVNTRDFLEKIQELKAGFFAALPEPALDACTEDLSHRDKKALKCTSTVYNRVIATR